MLFSFVNCLYVHFLSLLSDSNQRPRDYKSRALANNQVRFAHSQFRNGTLNDCRFTSVAFDGCDLVEADFSHASLRGIDLRTSRISGITLNISDLKGAIITSLQAMDLLPLLGVVIED